MKKLILLVALLTLTLSFTYGQASISGWGRGILSPVLTNMTDSWINENVSWGYGPRIGFTIKGTSDNVGAQVDMVFEGTAITYAWGDVLVPALGDQQKIWVKPVEMLTISMGTSCWDDTLRGNAGFVMNNWLRTSYGLSGDDYIFTHVVANAIVAAAPADGLYAYAALKGVKDSLPLAGNALANGQYGVGYDIPGIGLARAQLIGLGLNASADDAFEGIIEAAFKLTAVEGVMADIGLKYAMTEDTTDALMNIALYATYTMDTLMLHFAADVTLMDEDAADFFDNPPFRVALAVEYGLDGGLTAQADFRMWNDGLGADESTSMAFGAFAKWSYSNGIFGVGIEASNNNFAGSASITKEEVTDFVIALPIRVEFWF